jgi:hypothetical protein
MKKIFSIIPLTVISFMATAQVSWTIGYQKKTVLKNVSANNNKNIVVIKKSTLGGTASLTIKFNKPDTAYNLTLMADAVGEELTGLKSWEYAGKTMIISGKELKELFTKRKKIVLYYAAIPKDPNLAAIVRIGRVQVCTVLLQ